MRGTAGRGCPPGGRIGLSGEWGALVGRWCGRDPVCEGDVVDVEVDTGHVYGAAELDLAEEVAMEGFRDVDGRTWVRGTVVELDHAGVLTVRVADSHLLIETEGDLPLGIVGGPVAFAVPDLTVHPVSY